MIKRYFIREHPNSKKCKNVPYLKKKELQKEETTYTIVGKTLLKKYNSDKYDKNKDIEVIEYDNEQYLVKEKVLGFRKGYILLDSNEECIELKTRIPLLLLLFLLIGLLLFLCFHFHVPEEPKNFPVIEDSPVEEIIDEEIVTPSEVIEESISESSIEEKRKYKIIYHLNGGDLSDKSPTYYIEGKITKILEPIKEGYIFQGWFQNPNFEGKAISNISTSMKGDKNLYAKWMAISYIIKYHSDKEIKEKTYNYNQEYKLLKNPFKKKGYTFIGWALTKDDKIDYSNEETFKNLSNKNNTIIDLYAIWNVNEYSVIFKDYDKTIINESKLDYGSNIIYPEKLKRDGYNFIGWDNNSKIIEEDMIITAKYSIIDYKIDYELNDGTLKDPIKSYNVETSDFLLPIPNKKGYTFIGWNSKEYSHPEIELKISTGTIGDKIFNANWEANTYNVTLNANGGTVSQNVCKVKYDSNYNCLEMSIRQGYDFIGWFIDDEEITKDSILKKDYDHELTAKWKLNEYDITYDLDGGTLTNLIKKYDIEKEPISIDNPLKEGYIFDGWTINDNNNKIKDLIIDTGMIGNLHLQANYLPIQYSIIYDSNGGKGEMVSSIVHYDETLNLVPNQFEYSGKNFIGWSLTKDGEVIYKDQATVKNLTKVNDEKIVLYAKWETIYYNVTYYNWNNEIVKEESIPYQSKSNPPETLFRGGYTFVSWDKNDFIITDDTEYYPIFQKNEYSIKYNLNMGNADDINIIKYDIESNSFTLPTPSREGYTFLGWKDMETIKMYDSITVEKGSIGNKEYRAEWKANQYTITFNPNGGTMINTTIKATYNSLYGILPEVSRVGYTFEGWYYENELITEDSTLTKNYNHELTAKWKVINYTISYNLNSGSATGLITTYNVETESFTLPNPSRTGYTFNGWTGTELTSTTKNVTISKGSIGNRSYSADWSKNYYTVSYYKDGSLWTTRSVGYGDPVPNLTPTGYDDYHKFGGWSGWVSNMPPNGISLTAITSETYCMLQTGTASKANAEGLQAIFTEVGYRSWLYDNDLGWGALTDYSLSRRQVDGLREVFGNRVPWANATPYLNWLLIQCDNGHGESWKRYSNGNTWIILESW